jgi:hypothetical protein
MSKDKLKINITVDNEGDSSSTMTEEILDRIPRVGKSIYIVAPYPADDDVEDEKEKQVMAYSYTAVVAKAVILNDQNDEVTINGDYRIPLYKDVDALNRKLMVFGSEEEARDKWHTLMTVSLKEAERRAKKANQIEDYIREAIEKMHH